MSLNPTLFFNNGELRGYFRQGVMFAFYKQTCRSKSNSQSHWGSCGTAKVWPGEALVEVLAESRRQWERYLGKSIYQKIYVGAVKREKGSDAQVSCLRNWQGRGVRNQLIIIRGRRFWRKDELRFRCTEIWGIDAPSPCPALPCCHTAILYKWFSHQWWL